MVWYWYDWIKYSNNKDVTLGWQWQNTYCIGDSDPYNDVKQWCRILQTLKSYGLNGMSSDDSDVEGWDEVFHVNTLCWRQAEATAYMTMNKRHAINPYIQNLGANQQDKFNWRIQKCQISRQSLGYPLHCTITNDVLRTMKRRALQVDSTPPKWITLTIAKHTRDGCRWYEKHITYMGPTMQSQDDENRTQVKVKELKVCIHVLSMQVSITNLKLRHDEDTQSHSNLQVCTVSPSPTPFLSLPWL